MRALCTALALLLLSGCASLKNHVYCSQDGQRMVYVSWYHDLGLASKVSDEDARQHCPQTVEGF
jgi:uncharacterized protein YceK